MTHSFDELLCVSGLSDIFQATNFNWSQFTINYPGNWSGMRYNADAELQFPQEKVEQLYQYLYEAEDSIMKVVTKRRRW